MQLIFRKPKSKLLNQALSPLLLDNCFKIVCSNFLPNHRLLCACIECLRDAATFEISQSTCKMLEDDFLVAAEVPQHTLRLKNTALFLQSPKNIKMAIQMHLLLLKVNPPFTSFTPSSSPPPY